MKTPNLFRKFCFIAGLLLMGTTVALAEFQVKGQVTDQSGEPIIGASILEQGTTVGTVTDLDGNFQLTVSAKGAKLMVSYVGFKTSEATAEATMKVALKEDVEALEELVVVGYGVQKKSNVTGSISQVKAEDMQNRMIVDAASALQGKTSGVQIISSSSPGASPTVRIRGYSSNASSDPLYVVDGVRVKSIGGLDPNDIESMEILKDASSAAIYGAEAGNGVVLITTKRGKKGEGKIKYDMMITNQWAAKVPRMLNSEEYINYMSEAGAYTKDAMFTQWDGVTNTDWMQETFERGFMQRHNVSFSGGNDRGSYYLSLSYLDNDGIVRGNKDRYQRLTASVNADYQIKKWLKVGTTNQLNKYTLQKVSESSEYGSMFTSVLNMDPLTPYSYAPDQLPYSLATQQAAGYTLVQDENGNYFSNPLFYKGESYHPMIMRDNTDAKSSGFNMNGSIYADLMPVKGLTITSRFGYRLSAARSNSVSLPYVGNTSALDKYVGLSSTNSNTMYYQWENFANYMGNWNGHGLNAMVGMSFQKSDYEYVTGSLTANGEDVVKKNDPLFYYLNYAQASATKGVSGENTLGAKYSYFGRVSYDYKNRYMVQVTFRADAADLSVLPKTNRWGYFPSVSAGWTMSEESWFEPAKKAVDMLKIRAGWGQNGSLGPLSGYLYSAQIATGGFYAFKDGKEYTTSAAPATMGNDKLKWETSEQFNVGVDAYFLNGRLNFTAEYFNKRTKDLLVSGTTPSLAIGGSTSPMNAGNVSNLGFELDLGWRDKVGDFSYGISGNLSTLKNKVTYLDPSISRIAGATFHTYTVSYFEQNYPVYYFRGYKFDGIDPATGNPTFKDLNEDGQITEEDKTYIGDAIPSITYGLTINMAWKGLDLIVFGSGAAGNKIFNCVNRPDNLTGNKLYDFFYSDRWTADNTNGTQPRAGAANMDLYAVSDAMVFDASYFKLKQIQLGYTLPQKWTKKAFINTFRIYCSLEDFFTITKYKGFDPEANSTMTSGVAAMGIDKGAYPTSRKLVVGLNVEF